MMRNKPSGAVVYGVDLGKNLFHVVGTDPAGKSSKGQCSGARRCYSSLNEPILPLSAWKPVPGSQWFARKLQAMGHTVRIIPAQFVKPYVKSNKNDTIDAAAIAEAVTRPTMRFVEVKTTGAGRSAGVAPDSRPDGDKPHASDLPDAGLLPRVRRRDPPGRGHVQGRISLACSSMTHNDLTPDDASAPGKSLR